jgi:hypothetical protein
MRKWIVELLPASAFYLFALAAQVSGYTSSVVALILAGAATVMLLVPVCHHAKGWHDGRKERGMYGLDSLWIIGLCAAIAFIAMSAGFYGLGLRAATKPHSDVPKPVNSAFYLKDAHLYSGSLSPPVNNPRFEAKFTRSGQKCRLFIDDRYYPGGIMGRADWIPRPLIELPKIEDFVPGQTVNVALLTPFDSDGRKLWRWGPPTEQPDPKTTFSAQAWHRG